MNREQIISGIYTELSKNGYFSVKKKLRIKTLLKEQEKEIEDLNNKINLAIQLTERYGSGLLKDNLLKLFKD